MSVVYVPSTSPSVSSAGLPHGFQPAGAPMSLDPYSNMNGYYPPPSMGAYPYGGGLGMMQGGYGGAMYGGQYPPPMYGMSGYGTGMSGYGTGMNGYGAGMGGGVYDPMYGGRGGYSYDDDYLYRRPYGRRHRRRNPYRRRTICDWLSEDDQDDYY